VSRYLTSEIEQAERQVRTCDTSAQLIKMVLQLADRGVWDTKIDLPTGRKLTVRQIIKMYNLMRFVNDLPAQERML